MTMSPASRYGSTWSIILVDSISGLDHEHDAARALEQAHELLDRVGSNNLRALCFVGNEVIYLGDGAVEDGKL